MPVVLGKSAEVVWLCWRVRITHCVPRHCQCDHLKSSKRDEMSSDSASLFPPLTPLVSISTYPMAKPAMQLASSLCHRCFIPSNILLNVINGPGMELEAKDASVKKTDQGTSTVQLTLIALSWATDPRLQLPDELDELTCLSVSHTENSPEAERPDLLRLRLIVAILRTTS